MEVRIYYIYRIFTTIWDYRYWLRALGCTSELITPMIPLFHDLTRYLNLPLLYSTIEERNAIDRSQLVIFLSPGIACQNFIILPTFQTLINAVEVMQKMVQMAKTFQIKQQGPKWPHPGKEYLNCDWTPDTKILMSDVQGGDILSNKRIMPNCEFWLSYHLLKNVPNQVYFRVENCGNTLQGPCVSSTNTSAFFFQRPYL